MVLGLIDFGRALYTQQVITHLTREGSNLASRGTDPTDTVNAVATGANPLNLDTSGVGMVTGIKNDGGTLSVVSGTPARRGALGASSKIWNSGSKIFNLPVGVPTSGQTIYVTEVYYLYAPVTPIGNLLHLVMPSTLYDVAYF